MDPDAYRDDMVRFLRLSDVDVDRMFRGLPPGRDEDLRDLADFLTSATEALARPPRSDVEAGHLTLLAAAARLRSHEAPTPASATPRAPIAGSTERSGLMRSRTVRSAAKVAVATASIVLMTAALAFAGVDLPGTAAETAFQKVLGVDLPNQAGEHAGAVPEELPESASETAVAVLDVIREWRSGAEWNGCEFGARVSAAARGLEGEPDTSHCAAGDGEGDGDEADGVGGSAGSGKAANADEGLGTADEASGGVASDGTGNADDGLGTAGDASDGAGSSGAADGDADEGLGTADDASDGAIDGVDVP